MAVTEKNVWCSLAAYHCPLVELYIDRKCQIGVQSMYKLQGGHVPQCPIAGDWLALCTDAHIECQLVVMFPLCFVRLLFGFGQSELRVGQFDL